MSFPTPDAPPPLERPARRTVRNLATVLAGLAVALSVPAGAESPNRVERLRQQELRVASMAYRLAISNPILCGEALEPQQGFVAHGLGPIQEAAREGDGSSDEPDDRAGGERSVGLGAVLGCSSRVALLPSPDVNAWADGENVVITTAMLDQCWTDDELALVIAHEMAHNILRHRDRLVWSGVSATGRAPVSEAGLAMIRETEDEADRFAASMARAAGYDLQHAVSFLERLVRANGLSAGAAATHSASSLRLASWSVETSGAGVSGGL